VQDLAGLHVAFVVVAISLEGCEGSQAAERELRRERERLHGHDQRVASEQRDEPRNTGNRDPAGAVAAPM
jgi:hypothetical protein